MDPNLDLGQHFMVDTALINEIIRLADISEDETILEIGPGKGALTAAIKNSGAAVLTVEKDERFTADHKANILDIIDGLTFDKIVSNLPYHISEPLFLKLTLLKPSKIVVVVGEKFAKLLITNSILGKIIRAIYDVSVEKIIKPEAFDPPPKVNSALVVLDLKKSEDILADFYRYPKSKVKNYIKTLMEKRKAQEFIKKLPVPIQEKRLFELSTEEFNTMISILPSRD